ncbi:sulfurtransferase [Microbacterium sp. RD1]|uniref:sulfurtransferase n=1 Tax=Microbacterium sp. RD1 TaxID=3457313 RepID=UPI003FA60A45
MVEILVQASELAASLEEGAAVRLLDVRWRLDRPDGRPDYEAGHLPGAVYVDLGAELADPHARGQGRHPLPDAGALQEAARGWGVRQGDLVVVYDDWQSMAAARAWWVLADAGLKVRILDGGLRAWTAFGGTLETGNVEPSRGDVVLATGRFPRLSIDDAAAFPASGTLLDVRAPERYRGDVEPIDPRAGHIPGAINLPTAGNLDQDGRFLDPERLRERALAAGAGPEDPVGVYCGSGITAAHASVALMLAGYAPQLFPGSWSQWSTTPGRPVATGSQPG